jgi:hypothetical protein
MITEWLDGCPKTELFKTLMPKGTKVEQVYEAVKRSGKSAGSAARIAQAQTGKSLATGKKPKGK